MKNASSAKENRQSNIELLRIISVILIILYHLSRNAVPTSTADSIITNILSPWGMLGANCFIAISSYFLTEQRFRTSRIVGIFIQMLTYGLIFLAVRLVYDYVTKGAPIFSNFVQLFCDGLGAPFWVTRYWFIWTYILLCIVSPFLNILLNSLSKKGHAVFLVSISFIIIYGTFSNGNGIVADLAYFIYIYAFISYIKKFPNTFIEKHSVSGSIIMTLIFIVSKILLKFFPIFKSRIFYSVFDTNRHSAYMVIMSLFVFCAFKNMKMKQSRIINSLALHSLGIYLFHENCIFNLADLLCDKLNESFKLPASVILVIGFAVLIVTALIADFAKRETVDKTLIKLINKLPLLKRAEEFMNLESNE